MRMCSFRMLKQYFSKHESTTKHYGYLWAIVYYEMAYFNDNRNATRDSNKNNKFYGIPT